MDLEVEPRVDGWRLKVGKINPTTCDYPNNYTALAPPGVKMVATSSGAASFDRGDMADARARRREAAEMLDEWGVDCIVAGGGPVSTLEGADAEDSLIEEVQAAVSVPFTTSLAAQVAALEALGAESLLAVTPFPEERDGETRRYLEERGFEVPVIGGVDLPRPSEVRDLPPTVAYQCATALADRTDAAFDTVYVACSPFGSVEYIEHIERDTGRPVVMSAQAQMWKAFRMGGISPDPTGRGQLFEATWG